MRMLLIFAMGLALCGAPARAQQPAPLVRVENLKPVSAHVQLIPDNSVPMTPNVGFVVGSKGVLVVDTGMGARNGAAVAATAQRIAPGRTIYIVATHAHPEHDLGAQAFPPDSKMIRAVPQAGEMANDLQIAERFAAGSPAAAELLKGAEFRVADITFEDTYSLDLGGVTATLKAVGPAHTAGDTAIWIESDRVLFAGDLAMTRQLAIGTPKATLATWAKGLDYLESVRPQVVIGAHGPIGDLGLVRGYRVYLKEIAERTRAARAKGGSLEAVTETVWQGMSDRYPDRGRVAGVVKMIVEEGAQP